MLHSFSISFFVGAAVVLPAPPCEGKRLAGMNISQAKYHDLGDASLAVRLPWTNIPVTLHPLHFSINRCAGRRVLVCRPECVAAVPLYFVFVMLSAKEDRPQPSTG